MSTDWIQMTPKLQDGVNLINSIEPAKLRLMLNRIVSHMENNQPSSTPFSGEEEMKLEKSLGLESKEVCLVIDSASLILQQAAYHVIKPEALKVKLIDGLKIDSERANVIVTVWSSNASSIVESLRKRSVLPHQLSDVLWSLNVNASSNLKSRMKEPVAILDLHLSSSENRNTNSKVQVEMRKPELQMLYQKLEEVQSQLDNLK